MRLALRDVCENPSMCRRAADILGLGSRDDDAAGIVKLVAEDVALGRRQGEIRPQLLGQGAGLEDLQQVVVLLEIVAPSDRAVFGDRMQQVVVNAVCPENAERDPQERDEAGKDQQALIARRQPGKRRQPRSRPAHSSPRLEWIANNAIPDSLCLRVSTPRQVPSWRCRKSRAEAQEKTMDLPL